MGVKGLTSFVRQIQHSVSEEVTIPVEGAKVANSASSSKAGSFVIDGWAWIYRSYLDHFAESARGGDYIGYSLHVRQVVNSLRRAGLEPIFVFDGPYLPLKIPTVLSRLGETAAGNALFMRSSSRSKVGYQALIGFVPPLLYDCTLEALRQCNVYIVIEEIEADSAVAELADKKSGWAVSNDSDFFILCARGTQCRGYVPIDSLHYLVKPSPTDQLERSANTSAATFEDDGFEPVGKSGKARRRKEGQGVVKQEVVLQVLDRPPQSAEEGSLAYIRFTSYSSAKLAAALGINTTMLPLLAALVGNDYTAGIQRRILDPVLPNGPQRITFIANTIKTETLRMGAPSTHTPSGRSGSATPSASRIGLGRTGSSWGVLAARGGNSTVTSATVTPVGDAMHPVLNEALAALALHDPVRFMVQRVVERILANVAQRRREAYVTSGEQEKLVDAIIDSVCTYSLLSDPSSIHRSTPSSDFFGNVRLGASSLADRKGLQRYRDAYNNGYFDRALVESLTQRICTNRMAPEDPNEKSIQSTHARDLRNWAFSILFATWGMEWARETLEEPLPLQDQDQDQDTDDGQLSGPHPRALPILAGPGPHKVNWDLEGDPEELIPVETPPSSFGSSLDQFEQDDGDDEVEDGVHSRPGSAAGLADKAQAEEGVKPPPVVADYSRKGDRYAAELCPILTLDALIVQQRQQLGIEPPQALRKYLRA